MRENWKFKLCLINQPLFLGQFWWFKTSKALECPKIHMGNLWVGVSKRYYGNSDIFNFCWFIGVQSSNFTFFGHFLGQNWTLDPDKSPKIENIKISKITFGNIHTQMAHVNFWTSKCYRCSNFRVFSYFTLKKCTFSYI